MLKVFSLDFPCTLWEICVLSGMPHFHESTFLVHVELCILLENDVFPKLAQKGFLYSYLSSEGETHIHSEKDKKLVRGV